MPNYSDNARSSIGIQEELVITSVPTSSLATPLRGKPLSGSTLTITGSYTCSVDVSGLTNVDFYLRPSVIPAAYLFSATAAGLSNSKLLPITSSIGANFVVGTMQKMSVLNLNGISTVRVAFAIVSASCQFDVAEVTGR